MAHIVYRLTEPFKIEAFQEKLKTYSNEDIIVKPKKISICNADNRYFKGLRSPEALKKKLPMALFHEGVGQVVSDPRGEFHSGDWVVLLPNIVPQQEVSSNILENYLPYSQFLSSGFDGFAQSEISLPRKNILAIPENIDHTVTSFIEMISVGSQLINRFSDLLQNSKHTVVWGDGTLGFIIALLIKHFHKKTSVSVVGVDQNKLDLFDFVEERINITQNQTLKPFDIGIEVVGGGISADIVNQMIHLIQPMGNIFLMGVSENLVALNTRDILEKGLTFRGLSRSNYQDFEKSLDFLKLPCNQKQLLKIIYQEVDIHSIEDIYKAFERFDEQKGKVVLNWHL